jgi:RNA polymerase sigma factor (sigma-70 family)
MHNQYKLDNECKISYIKYRTNLFSSGEKLPKEVQALRNIESDIVLKYQKLVFKISNKQCHNKSLFDDCVSEGNIALFHSVYAYTDKEISFITFCYTSISRSIFKFIKSQKYPKGTSFELSNSYFKIKKDLSNSLGREVSFNEACEEMNLSKKDKKRLQATLSEVISIDGRIESGSRVGEISLSLEDKRACTSSLSKDDIIAKAKLNNWEKIVLQAYFDSNGSSGWQTEVAENNINPKTNKSYSRAAPAIAMERVKSKISGLVA